MKGVKLFMMNLTTQTQGGQKYIAVESETEEYLEVASQNHALIQLRLGSQLLNWDDKFNAATELSLDVSSPERQKILDKYHIQAERELKPDICLYYADEFDYLDPTYEEDDVVRVEQVPLLCVEVVSPSQGNSEILRKFRVYFALGVKSCWYVDPNLKLIQVYSSPKHSKTFDEGEVVDSVLAIRLPLNKIFAKKGSLVTTSQ
jgi:Uma2 family endonuclease